MSIPKDPIKFQKWFDNQKPKTQRKWADPDKREKLYGNLKRNHPKGSDSCHWKGDNLSYCSAHLFVSAIKPKPGSCAVCGSTSGRLELANLDGYYNRDPNNYVWLCTKCHRKMDGHAYKKMKIETRHGLYFNQYYQAVSSLFLGFETL